MPSLSDLIRELLLLMVFSTITEKITNKLEYFDRNWIQETWIKEVFIKGIRVESFIYSLIFTCTFNTNIVFSIFDTKNRKLRLAGNAKPPTWKVVPLPGCSFECTKAEAIGYVDRVIHFGSIWQIFLNRYKMTNTSQSTSYSVLGEK